MEYRPLQYHLYNVINKVASLKNSVAGSNVVITDLPGETLKMATAVVATGPIILLWAQSRAENEGTFPPFSGRRYFYQIKG